MSFAGIEDLKPMARGLGPESPGKIPYTHLPAGKAFELQFDYKIAMTFIGTFGSGHDWNGHYIELHAYDEASARAMMHEKFGPKWCAIYSDNSMYTAEEVAGVKKYNYKKLTNDMIREKAQEAAKPFNPIEGAF
jgi:hypothetical protein